MNELIVYPNAPLIEAVFEIRFPGEPAVECRRADFFSKVRSKYQKVYVPKAKDAEQAVALIPYQFRQEDDKAGVMIALNRFAFFSRNYQGFNLFKKEALELMRIFIEMFSISKLNRIGLRYTNIIPFARDKDDSIPINNLLGFELNFPDSYPNKYTDLTIAFKSSIGKEGSITTRIENIKSEGDAKEAVLLDFDYAKVTNKLDSSKLESYIDESHKHTKLMFESLVTESYKKYLMGEMIE